MISAREHEVWRQQEGAHLWTFQFPRQTSHNIHRVGPANSDAKSTQTAAIGSMAIGTDQQQPGKRVVLQDDLVNDATAWFPETDSIFRAGRGEKVVDLFVDILKGNR